MSEEKPLTKVVFRDDDGKVETLWAFDLGENLYQLDNTPWYQYGASYKDVIEAVPQSGGELPLFRRVVEKSGYRTLRVALEEPATDVFLDEIKQLGCSFEGANRRYLALDDPPGIDLQKWPIFSPRAISVGSTPIQHMKRLVASERTDNPTERVTAAGLAVGSSGARLRCGGA